MRWDGAVTLAMVGSVSTRERRFMRRMDLEEKVRVTMLGSLVHAGVLSGRHGARE